MRLSATGPGVAIATLLLAGCAAAPPSAAPSASVAADASGAPPSAAQQRASPSFAATSSSGASPADEGERATGSATIRVDGTPYELEVAVCGWQGGGPSSPLQAEPDSQASFRVIAVQRVGGGMIAFELDWSAPAGNIDVSVLRIDPEDAASGFHYFNDRQVTDLIEVDGGRAEAVEPLTVFDASNITTAARHRLELVIVCDSFGGTVAGAAPIIAEITGIPLATRDVGQVMLNGESHDVELSTCARSADGVELEAESTDGSITLTLSARPGFTFLVFSLEGRVLTTGDEIDLQLDADGVRTGSPIRGEIAGRGPAEVTFDLPCA